MTTLTSPHDLLAAVPFLVGFHPTNSLVVIALTDQQIGMAMRIDFPQELDPDQIAALASHLLREGADSALIVAYIPDEVADSDFILEPLREAIALRGVLIRECLQVHRDRWRSTICQDQECCPPEGTAMPDISTSRISAEQVAAGQLMPFANLAELEASLDSLEVNQELLNEIRKIPAIKYGSDNVIALEREGALAVNELATEFSDLGIVEDNKLLALVFVRLLDVQVRDFAMGLVTDQNILVLASLWRWMLRIAPPGFVAPVATLFAATSYEEGDGALAQRALDRALADDSRYPMALLLRKVFSAGWPPVQFAAMRADLHPRVCALLFPSESSQAEVS